MPGKVVETIKMTQLFETASVTATGVLYNGTSYNWRSKSKKYT